MTMNKVQFPPVPFHFSIIAADFAATLKISHPIIGEGLHFPPGLQRTTLALFDDCSTPLSNWPVEPYSVCILFFKRAPSTEQSDPVVVVVIVQFGGRACKSVPSVIS